MGEQLGALQLAFVHVIEGATGGARDNAPFDYQALRQRCTRPGSSTTATRELAVAAMAEGLADAVAFGRPFIANPDLVERIPPRCALGLVQRETLYGGEEEGYTDYPTLAA